MTSARLATCLLVLPLLMLVVLSGEFFYVASWQERRAKDVVLKTIQTTYQALPQLPKVDAISGDLVREPSSLGSYTLSLGGNYYEQSARLRARYYIPLSGSDACAQMLRAIKEDLKWSTTSDRGECAPRRFEDRIHGDRIHHSIDARKGAPKSNEALGISVDISDQMRTPTGLRAIVEISIYHTLHHENWSSCIRDGVRRPGPCGSAYWLERWTPQNSNL